MFVQFNEKTIENMPLWNAVIWRFMTSRAKQKGDKKADASCYERNKKNLLVWNVLEEQS